jgi:hypothetical protein
MSDSRIPVSTRWTELAQQFGLIAGELKGVRTVPMVAARRWRIYPRKGSDETTISAFEATATQAGRLLLQTPSPVDPVDQWLDTVTDVWDSGAAVDGGMHPGVGADDIAFVERLVDASKLTCARLAASARVERV